MDVPFSSSTGGSLWRVMRALQPAAARIAALPGAAAAGVGRGLLWLLLAAAFGTVEMLVHVTEFGARWIWPRR